LETQRCIWPQFLGNWLAGPSVSKKHAGLWKLSAGFGPSFLETGWLAQEVRFPTLSSLLYSPAYMHMHMHTCTCACTRENHRHRPWPFSPPPEVAPRPRQRQQSLVVTAHVDAKLVVVTAPSWRGACTCALAAACLHALTGQTPECAAPQSTFLRLGCLSLPADAPVHPCIRGTHHECRKSLSQRLALPTRFERYLAIIRR